MNYTLLFLLAILPVAAVAAAAQSAIPSWVKTTAGGWADGIIDDETFIGSLEFLIGEGVIAVPPSEPAAAASGGIPPWVQNNAGWWADDIIDDETFISALQFLIGAGVIAVDPAPGPQGAPADAPASAPAPAPAAAADPADLDAALEECNELKSGREKIACRAEVKDAAKVAWYRANSVAYEIGPVTYYYPGVGTKGNSFYYQGEQPILDVTMLALNSRSDSSVALACTSPSICSYDIWDGSSSFKYTSTNFVSGQHVINPGDFREVNILFGPNIGYGGTEFAYDASKEYVLRIQESFGGAEIPLDLG